MMGQRTASRSNEGGRSGASHVRPAAYTGDDGKLRPELFDAEARDEAKLWVNSGIKTSQARRFFGAATAGRRRFDLRPNDDPPVDSEARVAMAMLKAETAYAAARDKARKPLADFVAHHAKLVKTIRDFGRFVSHFEAVVAWHRVFEEEKDRERAGGGRRNG